MGVRAYSTHPWAVMGCEFAGMKAASLQTAAGTEYAVCFQYTIFSLRIATSDASDPVVDTSYPSLRKKDEDELRTYVYFKRKNNRRKIKQIIADRELFRDMYIQSLYNNRKDKFFVRTDLGGGYTRVAWGKIVNFNLDSCINLSGLIWTSVIRAGSTNHRWPVLNLALIKNK